MIYILKYMFPKRNNDIYQTELDSLYRKTLYLYKLGFLNVVT